MRKNPITFYDRLVKSFVDASGPLEARGNFFRVRLYNLSAGVECSRARQGAMNDDLDAIRRVLAADVESFRRLVERYQRTVLTLIRNLTPRDTDREGVAQEVFLAAFRSLASFDPNRSAFSTWLFTIARNRCRNELARRRPVVGAELPDVVDLPSPERAASEAELFRQLDAALGALPFEQRSAFVLAHLQGLSYDEVGRIEGVGAGTVKSRTQGPRFRDMASLCLWIKSPSSVASGESKNFRCMGRTSATTSGPIVILTSCTPSLMAPAGRCSTWSRWTTNLRR